MTAPAVPPRLYRAAQVRELDRRAIEDRGIDGYELMTRAATAAFRLLRLRWPWARRLAVLCGGGNNGGDGLVVARLARQAGLDVEVALAREPERLAGSAARAWHDWADGGGDALGLDEIDPRGVDVVVDGLLGTGLDRPVAGAVAEAIARANASERPTLALDIPSGLDADTGAVLGDAVRADATITFIGAKRGLYTGQAADHTGPVFLDRLAVPAGIDDGLGAAVETIDAASVRRSLPRRRPGAHKGDAGHVLVVGGDHGFAGAARLAGEAALRCGAGLASVATRPEHAGAMAAARPELMAHPVSDPGRELAPLLARADVVALGPGLGRGDWGAAALAAVLEAGPDARVLDADALNLLADRDPVELPGAVLTPHPGEAGRLLGGDAAAVQANRFAALDALVARNGASVVLKGPGTLIATPSGDVRLLPGARPAMACGGMGDVLTGVIAALRGQGLDPAAAAAAGAWLHARAAELAAAGTPGASLLPSDLMASLGRLRDAPDGG